MLQLRRGMPVRWLWLLLALLVGCGGGVSTLHAKGKPSGSGPPRLDILNHTDVTVRSLFVAETESVDRAESQGIEPGSDEDRELWGEDLLRRSALPTGESITVPDIRAGRYDVLVVDDDGREQFVKGLKLAAGGKYVLELADEGWQLPR